MCSKSTWLPAIRREHAFTEVALRHGLDVTFVEPPIDVRSLAIAHPKRFFDALTGSLRSGVRPGLRVVARSTPVPGHKNETAETIDAALLRRILAEQADADAPTVCNLPWQWPAVAGRRRTVFDCADDWTRLFPAARHARFSQTFRRITDEADEVIVASSDLGYLFAGREVRVVPNGADPVGIATIALPRPNRFRLAYVGTLSERFDVSIVSGVLRALPEWSLDIYGPCGYAGQRDRPASELSSLLGAFADRVQLHGTIPRDAVPGVIDSADVLIVPNRPELSEGQSSMKLYDIAARGRPAVVSPGVSCSGGNLPPGTYVADGVDEWVAAVTGSAVEPAALASARIAWAGANTWEHRWPAWSQGVFGDEPRSKGFASAGN